MKPGEFYRFTPEEQELSAECPQCGGSGQNPDGPHGHCKACKGGDRRAMSDYDTRDLAKATGGEP